MTRSPHPPVNCSDKRAHLSGAAEEGTVTLTLYLTLVLSLRVFSSKGDVPNRLPSCLKYTGSLVLLSKRLTRRVKLDILRSYNCRLNAVSAKVKGFSWRAPNYYNRVYLYSAVLKSTRGNAYK